MPDIMDPSNNTTEPDTGKRASICLIFKKGLGGLFAVHKQVQESLGFSPAELVFGHSILRYIIYPLLTDSTRNLPFYPQQ